MSCYVCLKNTSNKSPCVCRAPIHQKCLYQMQKKMHLDHCTLCLEPFDDGDESARMIWILLGVVFYLLWSHNGPM